MALNEALCWYQHKIGAYDKQLWEETVEQRILSGLAHVPKKSGKLKLDYIDLDLVRGSSFPKLKPKHGILYISRLCLIRVILLPFFRSAYIDDDRKNNNGNYCMNMYMTDNGGSGKRHAGYSVSSWFFMAFKSSTWLFTSHDPLLS